MSDNNGTFDYLAEASFTIGGEDQLASIRARHDREPTKPEDRERLESDWERVITDLHIRTGTLLKTDTVSFLLGAGASRECGGPLIGSVPLELERNLIEQGVSGSVKPRIAEWLKCFYLAVRRGAGDTRECPTGRNEILARREKVFGDNALPLAVNFEWLLSLLHRWRAALPKKGGRLRLDGNPAVDVHSAVVDECLKRATLGLATLCRLPSTTADPLGLASYKALLHKVLTRPLNLKRLNVFTLNYDTLVEQAADSEAVVLVDGFVGAVRRTFRPGSYDHDLYFPAETTEGRVHRLDRVLHLYKLHGSITWTAEEPSWDNPYGVVAGSDSRGDAPLLIYPTPAKWGEALGMPYSELLRRFAAAIVRPQSVLFVIGYGFGDEHICAIVRQALAVPSFTLVIVDPEPAGRFVTTLLQQKDRRVWVFSGKTFGTFSGFVRYALADLRDQGIRTKVAETHRALGESRLPEPEGTKPEGTKSNA